MKTSLIVHFCIAGFGTRQDQASKLSSLEVFDIGYLIQFTKRTKSKSPEEFDWLKQKPKS